MSVLSKTFGGVRLTNKDAEKFEAQITHGRAKKEAQQAYSQGRPLANQFVKRGYAILKTTR